MSSGWLTILADVIRTRWLIWSLSHPDKLVPDRIPGIVSHPDALYPDDIAGVGISSGWVTTNSLCHPDDIPFHLMSSGWFNRGCYLIRMSYGNVIMSSGWHTLHFLSHPDEIASFDFSQHAVALQYFRKKGPKFLSRTYLPDNCHPSGLYHVSDARGCDIF